MPEFFSGLALLILAFAATKDVAARTVPNWLSIALAVDGLAWRVTTDAAALSVFAAGAVFVGATICWRHGLMGGGDVKLLAASALLVHPGAVPSLLVAVALAGGVLGVAYWITGCVVPKPTRRRPSLLPGRVLRIEQYRIASRSSLPYAAAIATGAAIAMTLSVAS